MFGIGGFELFIILIFGFLIFGPEKLPEIARTVGRGIARFREAQQEMNETLGNDKLFDPNNPDEPFKDPIEALDKLAARQEEKRRAKDSDDGKKAAAAKDAKGPKDAKAAAGAKAPAAATDGASDAASLRASNPEGGNAEAPEQTRPESFTERKARYERERAARKAAEAAEAQTAQPAGNAPEEAPADAQAPEQTSDESPSTTQPPAESPGESGVAEESPAEGGDD